MPTAKKAAAKSKAAPRPKAAEPDPDEAVVDAPVDGVIPEPSGPPAPITSLSTPESAQARVLWENQINDDAREFGRKAELLYIEATVKGVPLTISYDDPEE